MVSSHDIFATTSDHLRVYKVEEETFHVSDLKNSLQQELCAPLTSFDWNKFQTNILCCSSIDTTCTLWDIHQEKLIKQVITHDKEVLDVSFENKGWEFATVGFDATVRQFDIRDLNKSDILLEYDEPLVRVAFNNFAQYSLAVTSLEGNNIIILDTRKPMQPILRLMYHKAPVNNVVWSPYSSWVK